MTKAMQNWLAIYELLCTQKGDSPDDLTDIADAVYTLIHREPPPEDE